MRKFTPLLIPLLACSPDGDGEDVVLATDSSEITLALLNPTLGATPVEGVDSMRVDVVVSGEVVASETFDYPGGVPEITGIIEYGVVSFHVAGTDGTSVRSYGRSSEVVLEPGADLWVPITFLPINRVFALQEEMNDLRSEHRSMNLPDGRVLFVGGHDPLRTSSIDTIETYDPQEGVFSVPGAVLDEGVGAMQWAWTSESEILIMGGEVYANSTLGASDGIWLYGPTQDTVEHISRLINPRYDHCAAQYMQNAILLLGGEGTGTSADLLRWYTDKGEWQDTLLVLQNGFSSESAMACEAAADGRVFVAGTDADTTGIWDPFSGAGLGEAFEPISASAAGTYVSDPVMVQIEDGVFWMGGGTNLDTGGVISNGQEFRLESASYVTGTALATPRQGAAWDHWIVAGWVAVACGYSDSSSVNPVNKLELLNPSTGEKGPTVDLDRARAGCQVNSLPDGSILITGGYDESSTSANGSAAIMVPYIE